MSDLGIKYNSYKPNVDTSNVNIKKVGNTDKNSDSINTTNSVPSFNLQNKVNFSVKNTKLPDFNTNISFLKNDKADSVKTEQANTIKEAVPNLNQKVNDKLTQEIYNQAIKQ